MALTQTQKTDAYQFFAIAFGAAPGVEYMNQLNDAYVAGMTTKQIVNVYTTKPQFEAQYPRFLTNEQFADKLINNVVGASATDAAKAEAKADVTGALNAGWTKGDVVFQIFTNLAAKASTDAKWGATSQMLANKVAVAQYVTETLLLNSTDLTKLGTPLANVTADPATVAAAKNENANVTGQTFTLTPGADPVTGTAANDTINALTIKADGTAATTLSAFDVIDGGAGTDTLNIYSDNVSNKTLDANTTIKNVENINIFNSTAAFNSTAVPAVIDASKLVGVKNINQISLDTAITNLGDDTVASYKGGAVGTSVLAVTSTNTATKAAVALDGIAEGDTITFNVPTVAPANGGALNSITVSGTVADTNLDGTVATTNVGVTVGRDVQSLAVNTAVDTTLTTVTDGAGTKKVTTVDASASAGKVTYVAANTVANVTTGKGNDVVTLATAYTATLTAATVNGGEGNDTLNVNVTNAADATGTTVSAVGGAGNDTIVLNVINGLTKSVGVTVDAGAGNDMVNVNFAVKTTDSIDGGADTDTVGLAGKAARVADDYIVINKVLKNFEAIRFSTAEGAVATKLDASLLATNYTTLDFAGASFVDNVGAQALIARGHLTAEAKGYVNVGEGTPAATAITYAGSLNINALASGTINAHAETVNLTVTGGRGDSTVVPPTIVANNATLVGEAKTATVVLTPGTDTKGTVSAADDAFVASSVTVVTSVPVAPAVDGLAALSSLTLSGNGTANVTNGAGTALVTVDASALNSVDITGKAATGLVYVTTNTKAETIKLGAGLDSVTITGSTYTVGQTKMDTVEGLSLVLNAAKTAFDATKGDTLVINGMAAGGLVADGKFTTTETDLDRALLEAAKYKTAGGVDVNNVAFHLNGNTYVYSDVTGDNLVTTDDILVKLAGIVDLDILVGGL